MDRSEASDYPLSGKPVTENPTVVTVPPSAVLSAVPIRQPLALSAWQHQYRKMPGAVDAAADVVDVRGDPTDSGS